VKFTSETARCGIISNEDARIRYARHWGSAEWLNAHCSGECCTSEPLPLVRGGHKHRRGCQTILRSTSVFVAYDQITTIEHPHGEVISEIAADMA
jgi:hypothetical protein